MKYSTACSIIEIYRRQGRVKKVHQRNKRIPKVLQTKKFKKSEDIKQEVPIKHEEDDFRVKEEGTQNISYNHGQVEQLTSCLRGQGCGLEPNTLSFAKERSLGVEVINPLSLDNMRRLWSLQRSMLNLNSTQLIRTLNQPVINDIRILNSSCGVIRRVGGQGNMMAVSQRSNLPIAVAQQLANQIHGMKNQTQTIFFSKLY